MGGNVGNVVDGNVASKARDVGDNGGMTCGGEVSKGGVENACDMEVLGGGMEYSSVMEVSSVERPTTRPPRSPTRPSQPRPSPTTSLSPSNSDRLHPNYNG